MKLVIVLVIAIAVALLVVLAVGFATPKNHEASASKTYRLPPNELFAIVTDFKGYEGWRTGLKSIDVSDDKKRVVETGGYGVIPYVIRESVPGQRLVTEIDDSDLQFGGTWTFEFTAEGSGTRLTVTERGFVKNVVFRFVSRFMAQDATIKQFLADLAKRAG